MDYKFCTKNLTLDRMRMRMTMIMRMTMRMTMRMKINKKRFFDNI